jgi:hypothetical protein
MTRIAGVIAIVLLAASCAQTPRTGDHAFAEAVKQTKVTLVDAVQKASSAVSGAVVQASLQPATRAQTSVTYQVLILHDDKVIVVAVDAVTGAVGQPAQLARHDDDDDDEQNEVEAKRGRRPEEKSAASTGPTMGTARLDFDTLAPGSLPPGWVAAETRGAGHPGSWSVQECDGAPSGGHVLRLVETRNSGVTFNLMMSETVFPADLDLAVKIHADSGTEDRGGGLIWRASDADNYYIARWNPLEDNLRAYNVVGGKRSMLGSVDLQVDQTRWHVLRIRARGKSCEVSFDGKVQIRFEDGTFAHPGRVGVWTKADAASSFDDLEVAGKQ